MIVSATLEQTNEVVPVAESNAAVNYRVTTRIVGSENISLALIVFRTGTQQYSHPATLRDLELFPESREDAIARNLEFYRDVVVTKDFTVIMDAQYFQALLKTRIQRVVSDMSRTVNTGFPEQEITTISAGV